VAGVPRHEGSRREGGRWRLPQLGVSHAVSDGVDSEQGRWRGDGLMVVVVGRGECRARGEQQLVMIMVMVET
jgi:hypothetical protein